MTNKIQISEKTKDYLSLFVFIGYCTACGMIVEKMLQYDNIKRAYNKGKLDAINSIAEILQESLAKPTSVKKEESSEKTE